MLDVGDRLVEQVRDVVVMQVVDDVTAVAPADDESEVAQDAELMGHRGRLHPYRLGQLADGLPAGAQPPQDSHPAGGRQRLHRVRHRRGEIRVEAFGVVPLAVAHDTSE